MKYERLLVKQQMLQLEPGLRKKRKELEEEESDVDEEFISRYLVGLEEREKERLEKVMMKENEKRKEHGESPLTSLYERKRELGESIAAMSMERLEKKMVSLTERIMTQKTALVDKVWIGMMGPVSLMMV
jgi:DNA topoisomerase-1